MITRPLLTVVKKKKGKKEGEKEGKKGGREKGKAQSCLLLTGKRFIFVEHH